MRTQWWWRAREKAESKTRSTSTDLLLTCYLLVRFTPTMDADGWKQTAARGEGRKEGRKGWRSDGRWGTATLHLGRPTGATSFHIWYPVRPRSWNLPEKEIRASFTCSRALYVCSSRGENIDAPLLLGASRAPLVFPTRANHPDIAWIGLQLRNFRRFVRLSSSEWGSYGKMLVERRGMGRGVSS